MLILLLPCKVGEKTYCLETLISSDWCYIQLPDIEMSLNMFKCQVSNVFHQFKWVLCKNCHHSLSSPMSKSFWAALFHNFALRLFQLGNLRRSPFRFNFSLVLKANCAEGDTYDAFFFEDYLSAVLSHNNWSLPSCLSETELCTWSSSFNCCKTLQTL